MACCYQIKVESESFAEPITLEEAKRQLGFYDDERDAYVLSLIKAARETIQVMDSRALVDTQYVMTLQSWPRSGCIEVPRAQLMSVEELKYIDATDESEQVIDSANYQVDTIHTPGRIVPVNGFSWPSVSTWDANPIRIKFTSGYGGKVPESLRQAMFVAMRYFVESGELGHETVPDKVWDAIHSLAHQQHWGHYV